MTRWLKQRKKAAAYVVSVAALAVAYHVVPDVALPYTEFAIALGGLFGVHQLENAPIPAPPAPAAEGPPQAPYGP